MHVSDSCLFMAGLALAGLVRATPIGKDQAPAADVSQAVEGIEAVVHNDGSAGVHESPLILETAGLEPALYEDVKSARNSSLVARQQPEEEMSDEWYEQVAFVKALVDRMRKKYPSKNVVVYHNKRSWCDFVGPILHEHWELGIKWGLTKGYDALMVEQGTFMVWGEGGWANWGWAGNGVQDHYCVRFAPIGAPPPDPDRGRSLSARDSSSLTFDYRPFTGSRQSLDSPTNDSQHTPLHAPFTYTPVAYPETPASASNSSRLLIPFPPSSPVPSKNGSSDGTYLVQCRATDDGAVAQGLAYYNDLTPGQNVGQQPDDFTLLLKINGPATEAGSAHRDWKLPVGAAAYDVANTTFHWQIFGGAKPDDVAINEVCGSADNGHEHVWMFKDRGSKLFSKDGWDCDSLFYAF